jgi:hypothetical protein
MLTHDCECLARFDNEGKVLKDRSFRIVVKRDVSGKRIKFELRSLIDISQMLRT